MRAKIVSLLMVPVVSLLALWGFATVTTAQDMARLRQLQRVDADIRQPVSATLAALQDERRAAVRQLAAPGAARAAELKDRIRRTDEAVARLKLGGGHTVADSGDLPADVADRVRAFVGEVQGLARLRVAAADGSGDWDRVYDAYTTAVSAGFAVGGALSGIQDTGQGSHARVLLELARAGEMLSRQDALLGSAHLTGRLTAAHQRAFTGAAETRRTLLASATGDLPPAGRAAWSRLADGTDHARLTDAEDRVARADDGRPAAQAAPSADWDPTLAAVRTALAAVENDARTAAADDTDPLAGGILSPAGAAVVLGLVAVAASLVISVRIGRGLVVELVSLRNTALGIARRKLPAAMGRLRAGEEIDVRAEAPPGPAPQDEIGQVGEALTTVHRAALSAAVERAELASGISGVFVNLARRSQVLVHRQLNLLDSMERRADDPGELGDLFRLDHLTTRMRRHAESLIILSGAAPGRAWRMPVPLTNVVRAAVSEIEDYARVEVRGLPETAVAGGAVADLTHLLAELIENAAQFSPPHTKVRVSGEPVGNGYALEIEDRGLGMGKDTLAEANARIAQSEALDLFDSDRLGLFVVSRLSSRHAVKVHLRPSPYGGTTAVVLLPTPLLQPPGTAPTPLAATTSREDTRAAHEREEAHQAEPRRFASSTPPPAPGAPKPLGDTPTPLTDTASRADKRTAHEREEAHRAGARRFASPPAGPRTPEPATDAPRPLAGTASHDDKRAAREHEEARRVEARRFARPSASPRTPESAADAPKPPGENPATLAGSASRGDERAALEGEEARRAEARRFARPPATLRTPESADPRDLAFAADPRTPTTEPDLRTPEPLAGTASRGDERAAREREEARRAEARRFTRPSASPRTPEPAAGAPKPLDDSPSTPAQAPGSPNAGGAPPIPLTPPRPGAGRVPARPQSLPRPAAVPALGPGAGIASVPAGVTPLRPRGHVLPPQAPPDRTGHGSGVGSGESDGDNGLPRRIRQASLVPQLRQVPAAAPAFGPDVSGGRERTPEQVRDRMAAYRDGWARGGGPAPGVRRPLGGGAPSVRTEPPTAPHPCTRPYGDTGPAEAPRGAGHDAPYAPRSDARARTDLGPYFGARPNPPQDPRSEGDDA
ncbi:nitrate- and nitrite sensing domain-containing protein [Streptomyces sp. NPDC058527]|uniref:sensor histidine kinase n=1 Tax=Streptomyces sp. NPDC058527 TaxID=3346539 RepID=UPI00364D28A1